jgi:hypothetical protein
MKFKINSQFWNDIKTYLDLQEMTYTWNQEPDSEHGTLSTDSTGDWVCSLEHAVAQNLLSQFHKEKLNKQELTAGEWLQNYASSLVHLLPQDETQCDSLNRELLTLKYTALKNSLLAKKQTLAL